MLAFSLLIGNPPWPLITAGAAAPTCWSWP